MAAIAGIFSVVSGVVGAIGQIQSANAQAAAANYNAKVQLRNQQVAQQNIATSNDATLKELDDKRRDQRRTLAAVRAAYGGSGVDVAGSPLDVLADSAMETEADIQTTAQEGRVKKRELGLQAQGFGEQATLDKMNAKASKTAGYLGAFGTLVGTAGKALTRTA